MRGSRLSRRDCIALGVITLVVVAAMATAAFTIETINLVQALGSPDYWRGLFR